MPDNAAPSPVAPPDPLLPGGEMRLPRYLLRRAEGVLVDLAQLDSSVDFRRLVDRIFESGAYFSGLDYGRFTALLFDYDVPRIADEVRAAAARGMDAAVRFAADILVFRPERRALYKGVKFATGAAEYLFEPVMIEHWTEVPVYETDADGTQRLLRMERVSRQERASLDFDEFVAEMWSKGVCFGIDAEAVRGAIRSGLAGRLVVARDLPATEGSDAGIAEQTTELHRDNSPRVLDHGRADLTQFKNRFPQVRRGTCLLKKIPRVLGRQGRQVSGATIEPRLPKDINFAALAGPGTELRHDGSDEFIVAALDGFLSIDRRSNQVTITDHMVNREGVSMRTTGDLSLAGDVFEEFGEVQERRLVEGHSITIHADVFGTVSSLGGAIVLERNLVGGTATNVEGPITVKGLASGAVLIAGRGTVVVKRAENSLLAGARVEIGAAVNCEILADAVEIREAEGCTVAGRQVHLGVSRPGRHNEMRVLVLVPELSSHDAKIAALAARRDGHAAAIGQSQRRMDAMADARRCAELLDRVKRKELALNAQQAAQLRRMVEQFAPQMKNLAVLQEEVRTLGAALEEAESALAAATEARRAAGADIRCVVDAVTGETTVRLFPLAADAPPLAGLAPRELRARLRGVDNAGQRVFSGAGGKVDWTYRLPERDPA
jgi:hypothetical protein